MDSWIRLRCDMCGKSISGDICVRFNGPFNWLCEECDKRKVFFQKPKKEYIEGYTTLKSYRNALAMVEGITKEAMETLLTKTLEDHNVDFSIKDSNWLINPLCDEDLEIGLFVRETRDKNVFIVWVLFSARGPFLTQIKKALKPIFFPKDIK